MSHINKYLTVLFWFIHYATLINCIFPVLKFTGFGKFFKSCGNYTNLYQLFKLKFVLSDDNNRNLKIICNNSNEFIKNNVLKIILRYTGCFQLTRAERGVSYLQRRDFVSCIQGRFSISTKWGVFPKYGGATLCPVYKGTSHFSEGFLRLEIPDNSRARKKNLVSGKK